MHSRGRWAIVGLFALVCMATLAYNGPFFDESIYVTAGIRTLEGHGRTDGFLTWFAGSLVWPLLAGLGYRTGGLLGARAIAVLFGTVTLAALGRTARNLFDERTAFWATLAFALNGPFVALTRLAVYDVLALASIAVSFWALTELNRQDHRIWLFIGALAYPLAVIAKYPIGLMIVPLMGTLYFLRKEKAATDIPILFFLVGALGLILFLPVREQVGVFFNWRLENRPEFGVPLSVIGFAIAYLSAAPLLLGLWGWFRAGKRRDLGGLLLLSLGIWPLYHLLAGDPVGTNKHLVFGFLFVYPLVGVVLNRLWSRQILHKLAAAVLVLILAGLGLTQVVQADNSWPNLRIPAHYLMMRVQPGDRLLINESWPFTMYLYTGRQIESPWDVYDQYRITHEETAPDICAYEWMVDVRGSYAWPSELQHALEECGVYEAVISHTSTVINLGADFNYVSYPVETIVWENRGKEQ